MVPLDDWLVVSIWFLLSTGLAVIGRWCNSASLCRVVRAVVFTRQQLCCPTAATVLCQLLPQQGWGTQFWMLPSVPWGQLWDPHLPWFGRLACCPSSALSLHCFTCIHSLRIWHWEFGFLTHFHSLGQVQHSTPTSAVGVRSQFTVYVFQFCCGGSVCPGVVLDYFPG
jgi:hypothetical protein